MRSAHFLINISLHGTLGFIETMDIYFHCAKRLGQNALE